MKLFRCAITPTLVALALITLPAAAQSQTARAAAAEHKLTAQGWNAFN